MPVERSGDFPGVFTHFGVAEVDRPLESCYAYAPVFPSVVDGRRVAIKRTCSDPDDAAAVAGWVRGLAGRGIDVVAPVPLPVPNPAMIADQNWVAYPWIEGRPYSGSTEDIAAAGRLLGRIHAAGVDGGAGLPAFRWPDHDQASVDEDVDGLRHALGTHAPEIADPVLARFQRWLQRFMAETLPVIRDADLPTVAGVADYKANNLVWVADRPTLVDPDNAERLPRVLDLALAAVLFHVEQDGAPARPFTTEEWSVFLTAYGEHVGLEPREIEVWPTAVRYILLEWGVWTIVDAENWDDWADPDKRAFLIELATLDPGRFPGRM